MTVSNTGDFELPEEWRAADPSRARGRGRVAVAPQQLVPAWRLALRRGVAVLVWLYLLAILALWVIVAIWGDRWSLPTFALFAPLWPAALPALPLIPLALAFNRASLWPLVLALGTLFGPVMDWNVPWRSWVDPVAPDSPTIRVVTLNTGVGRFHAERFAAYVDQHGPDLIGLQEAQSSELVNWLTNPGDWFTARQGELIFASRWPIERVELLDDRRDFGFRGTVAAVVVRSPWGPIRWVNLHLRSPRDGLTNAFYGNPQAIADMTLNLKRRDLGSQVASSWIRAQSARDGLPTIVCGDFNQPTQSYLFRRDWGGFADAFQVAGLGYGHTWFSSWHGLRIDHVLGSPSHWNPRRCEVGPDMRSDHRPVLADLALRSPPEMNERGAYQRSSW
ncbi:Endonuclease/exonuclease/phosphatase [Isosphaera pallida ATCC 43644]|uniref:Endonuclease/exonuclease/phosphatase n=1 Tax=Isosphaera pallida (strain ATCC 43644 / DSM 9630 / IS1B) TaxID=575540 RepID=E8R4H0_ISOPI|nr:endonuclease/exonuclease/phosphatase family protein [Isosphaera pallida]ADV63765.1 Endonuclease/exonuclease/phosphatase [Isosphaera pallida ATCC 43644]